MRVVHQDHPLALQHRAVGRVLQLDAQIADVVGRLDEGAADIVVADDAELERQPAFLGVAHGGRHAGIGHRHHHVGGDRALARQLRADALARLVDGHALHHRVGAGEVDVFEDAEPPGMAPNGLMLCTPLSLITTISPGSTSRTNSAPTMSSAQVSRREHPAASAIRRADAAQDQRPHAQRVAHAHQRLVGQRDQRIGAHHLLQRVDQPVDDGGIQADGDEVDEHLAVGGGLEQAAAAHQRACSASALVRLPLWATAKPPNSKSA